MATSDALVTVLAIGNSRFDGLGVYRVPEALTAAVRVNAVSTAQELLALATKAILVEMGFEVVVDGAATTHVTHPAAPLGRALLRFVTLDSARMQVLASVGAAVHRTIVNVYAHVRVHLPRPLGAHLASETLRALHLLSAQIKDAVGWPMLWSLCALSGVPAKAPFELVNSVPELMDRVVGFLDPASRHALACTSRAHYVHVRAYEAARHRTRTTFK